ncbi:MAG: hypothetical protein KF809_17655 [Chloroflexi bacterium]|nr:hypothetical protein [Chloroflexota bacterium]
MVGTNRNGVIMTVRGPVDPGALGLTLTHEHLHIDGTLAATDAPPAHAVFDHVMAAEARWNPLAFPANLRFTDLDLVCEELEPFVTAGGNAIVDLTPNMFARDPRALATISERSGIHVIMGGSHYTEPFHPAEVRTSTPEALAEGFIREIRDGVGDTGIRPGIMGEVGASDPLGPGERVLLRAHAIAAVETGVPISIHQQSWGRSGHEVLDILESEGLSPTRVVMGHVTPVIDDDRYQVSLMDRGTFLGYDFLGIDHSIFAYGRMPPDPAGRFPPNDYDVLVKLKDLISRGYADRVLLSGDNGELVRMRRYGGWGFAHIPLHLVPLAHALGIEPTTVDSILHDNPRRMLTIGGS